MELREGQKRALEAVERFVGDKDCQVFILKGYAGTGKTTLIKAIVPIAESKGKRLMLMAPTGRAAKILRDKLAREASTIHKAIYSTKHFVVKRHDENGNLVDITTAPEEDKNSIGIDELHYYFKIKDDPTLGDPAHWLIIVDESSMVSSVKSNSDFMHFGTDVLLDDLLTFAKLHKGAKIIFVGDPAQLPPVGDRRSAALDENFFAEKGLRVDTVTLTETIRQASESAILRNAMMIRDLQSVEHCTTYVMEMAPGEVEEVTQNQVVEQYLQSQPIPEVGQNIIVCFSNAKVKEYNDHIRDCYFPGSRRVMAGDILQVVTNNYNLPQMVFNGDFVKVIAAADTTETHSAPVWISVNGGRKRVEIPVDYRKITIMTADGHDMECYLVENVLDSPLAGITSEQRKSMYIDFLIRHDSIRKNTDLMTSALMSDPYFNALQAKYGYAITAHKSQGGEWETAYVDFTDRKGTDIDCLRWAYTAVTRASKRLYCIEPPHITPLSKFRVNPINRITRPQPGNIVLADVPCRLMPNAKPHQKAKCNSAEAGLAEINCCISEVTQMPYRDRYNVCTPDGPLTVDCVYNGSGVYTSATCNQSNAYIGDVMEVLTREPECEYTIEYAPQLEALANLYNKMVSVCDELGIKIKNIVEKGYSVTYHLKTSGRYSYLQCYFNNQGFVTSAIPSSDLGADDALLKSLIDKLLA